MLQRGNGKVGFQVPFFEPFRKLYPLTFLFLRNKRYEREGEVKAGGFGKRSKTGTWNLC
jgi:hypothetical protein